jgi:hypothetical protein
MRLMASFIAEPAPIGPHSSSRWPHNCSSTGRARAMSAASPLTRPSSLPCRAGLTEPPTGASSIAAPFALTFSASEIFTEGNSVLISTNSLPEALPDSRPEGPL